MDLKTVMPGFLTPSHIELPIANTAIGSNAAAPLIEDSLIIELIEMLKSLSAKTVNAVNEQNALLQVLPASVRSSAEHILQQSLPNLNTLSAGLTALLYSRRDAAHSLTELAQKLQWATEIFQSTTQPAEVLTEIKQFHQQVQNVLEQIAPKANEMDQADLHQVREQIRSAIPYLLRQVAEGISQKAASTNPSIPANILKAAETLNLPELPQLWLLAKLDSEDLYKDNLKGSLVETKHHTAQAVGKESLAILQNTSQAKPAVESLTALNRFAQQITDILSQLDFDAPKIDPVTLQQAKEQVRAIISNLMQQTAENFVSLPSGSGGIAIPLAIRQAVVLLDLPELLQLWPLSDKELVALLTTTPASRLEQSAVTVRTLSELVNRAFIIDSDDQAQAAIFTLQMPFLGESTHLHPVHIHIYHEKSRTKQDGSKTKPDTWVRLTLEPEHTGSVTAIFHLREAAALDIKVIFADKKASLLFAESVPLIRKACSDLPFLLGDVSII